MPKVTTPTLRRAVLVLSAFLAAFAVLRLPLYSASGVQLGWNSDSAIFGLIAKQMVEERRIVWFFWGQDYLGTLTSMMAVVGSIASSGEVRPLALRIGVAVELIVALLLFADALRRIWGDTAALLMLFWLAAGPSWFFKLSYAPNAEQMFLVGAVIFWYVLRGEFVHLRQWFVLGALSGIGWWAHRGAVLMVPAALMTIVFHDDSWRRVSRLSRASALFLAGAAAGAIPIVLGRAQVDQMLYQPVRPTWSIQHVSGRIVETLSSDVWAFLGTPDTAAGVAFGLVIIAFSVIGARQLRMTRGDLYALGCLATCFAFWVCSTEAYSGATRYLVLALPIAFGLAGRGVHAWWSTGRGGLRIPATVAAVLIASVFYGGRAREVQTIVAGAGEQHESWPGGFDPRPTLHALQARGCEVGYADFWLAYKLEWLSGVPFVPYRSVDRTEARSLRLASSPDTQCFVDKNGDVLPLDETLRARFREETIAHARRRRSGRFTE